MPWELNKGIYVKHLEHYVLEHYVFEHYVLSALHIFPNLIMVSTPQTIAVVMTQTLVDYYGDYCNL